VLMYCSSYLEDVYKLSARRTIRSDYLCHIHQIYCGHNSCQLSSREYTYILFVSINDISLGEYLYHTQYLDHVAVIGL